MVSQQSRFLANFTILILAHRIFPGQHSFTLSQQVLSATLTQIFKVQSFPQVLKSLSDSVKIKEDSQSNGISRNFKE